MVQLGDKLMTEEHGPSALLVAALAAAARKVRPDQVPIDTTLFEAIVSRIGPALVERAAPLVVGLCGAQGSGKSTVAAAIARHFETRGVATAVLSLDDLYRTRREREALAHSVHPLLYTRGVPGTHDVALGLERLAGIDAGAVTPLPRFDKGRDDRAPRAEWEDAAADTRLVLFEGWCVGARAQPTSALSVPVNLLERTEDPDGVWRAYSNAALAGEYQRLFARIDMLVLLAAPDFDTVFEWRAEQEAALRARTGRGMSGEEIMRFVQHYERLTRHILAEMPARADLVIQLDTQRRAVSVTP